MERKIKICIFLCLVMGVLCIGYLKYYNLEECSIDKSTEMGTLTNSTKNEESEEKIEKNLEKELDKNVIGEDIKKDSIISNEENEKFKEITISAVGDIMVHDSQLDAQYNENTDTYDFNNNFQYVKEYISEADIAIANFEGTLAGKENVFSGYPVFNAPDTIIDAVKNCGFDVLSTANNHTIDKGSIGVTRTLKEIKNKELKVIGTRSKEEEDRFIIENIKGINIGFISYTYETPRKGEIKTLNAIQIPKDVEKLINTFSYEHLDENLSEIEKQINSMKEKGAELIVFVIHWGNEYERKASWYQEHIAQQLCNYGVDIILGSHPHVVQLAEFIETERGNKKTLVVYSMGNFLSNQQFERTENPYTEDGVIVNVKIKKDIDSGKININEVSYIPTWVHRYNENEKFSNRNEFIYKILPLFDALEDPQKYGLELESDLLRAEESMKHTVDLIKSEKEIVKEPTIKSKTVPTLKNNY